MVITIGVILIYLIARLVYKYLLPLRNSQQADPPTNENLSDTTRHIKEALSDNLAQKGSTDLEEAQTDRQESPDKEDKSNAMMWSTMLLIALGILISLCAQGIEGAHSHGCDGGTCVLIMVPLLLFGFFLSITASIYFFSKALKHGSFLLALYGLAALSGLYWLS